MLSISLFTPEKQPVVHFQFAPGRKLPLLLSASKTRSVLRRYYSSVPSFFAFLLPLRVGFVYKRGAYALLRRQ